MPALWKKIYPIARSPCQENTHAKQASFFVVVCLFVWGFVVVFHHLHCQAEDICVQNLQVVFYCLSFNRSLKHFVCFETYM